MNRKSARGWMLLVAIGGLVLFSLVACNPAGSKLAEAKKAFATDNPASSTELFRAVAYEWPESPEAMVAKDYLKCLSAKEDSFLSEWRSYLAAFPKGKCADEAKEELEHLDKKECKEATRRALIDGWQDYLKKFPEGTCVKKAKDALRKLKEAEQKVKQKAERAKKAAQKAEQKENAATFRLLMLGVASACEDTKKKSSKILRQAGINSKRFWEKTENYLVSHAQIAKMLLRYQGTVSMKTAAWEINLSKGKLAVGVECSRALAKAVEMVSKNCLRNGGPTKTEWIKSAAKAECD